MKRILCSAFVGLAILGLGLVILWFVLPQTTARALLAINNASAGLSKKTIQTDFGEVHYLEGGDGDTIVLIHGIYARKEHWGELARGLKSDFHIIALDLPGFGDNEPLADEQYMLRNQMINLASVLDALEIENTHIAANSMGAQIAAMLADTRPDLVRSLAFIGSPLGVPTLIKSDMDLALESNHNPLLVKNEDDFHARNEWLFPQAPSIPSPILKTWAQKEISIARKNERIWPLVHNFSSVSKLLNLAPNLNVETLIVWCDRDRIFHVSGAEILHKSLPNSSLSIFSECGHVPMLDKPDTVSAVYRDFLKGSFSTRSTEHDLSRSHRKQNGTQ